ncbi:MAG: hypothetical protein KH100_15285 [Dysgonomonas mossii]|uniref:hypothetical protein n=1 Tax=Dysgonomonas mossii TaxID=163665 RepID=UPI001DDEFDF2|nr:hypothetical protein [Dysgonomonas mossii]MBS5798050.1 hypothetical protein [Dysgonomonas mossii]MBS7112546.1 hypothetical protein [Dysgonomonas mossii]
MPSTGQAIKVGDIWTNILSSETGENVNYIEVSQFADGTEMSDSKLDNVIYRKKGDLYLRQAFDLTKSRTLTVDTINDIRNMSLQNIILLKLGYYNKVTTKGYYSDSDGGAASYSLMENIGSDDGFMTINAENTVLTISLSIIQEDSLSTKQAGVKGDGIVDDTSRMQVFISSFAAFVYSPIISGNIRFRSKLVFDGTGVKFDTIKFDCKFRSDFESTDEVVRFLNFGYKTFTGTLVVYGKGDFDYSTRKNYDGVVFENCARLIMEYLDVRTFQNYGVRIEAESPKSNTLLTINKLRTAYCGSMKDSRLLTSKLLSYENLGSVNSLAQYSTITLDIDFVSEPNDNFILIGERIHQIKEKTGTKQYKVFPWVDTTSVIGTTDCYALTGGGLKTQGGDTTVIRIGDMDAIYCGVGYRCSAIYPGITANFVSQFCGVGFALGRQIDSAALGGSMGSGYFENNSYDIVKVTVALSGYTVLANTALNMKKVATLFAADTLNNANQYHLDSMIICKDGYAYQDFESSDSSATSLRFTPTASHIRLVKTNTHNINLTGDDDVSRLFRGDFGIIIATGAGNALTPTGSYTFTPASDARINGMALGAPLVVSGMTSATLFFVQRLKYNNTWKVWHMSLEDYVSATTSKTGLVKKSAALTAGQPSETAPSTYDPIYIKTMRDRVEDLIQKLKDAGIQT